MVLVFRMYFSDVTLCPQSPQPSFVSADIKQLPSRSCYWGRRIYIILFGVRYNVARNDGQDDKAIERKTSDSDFHYWHNETCSRFREVSLLDIANVPQWHQQTLHRCWKWYEYFCHSLICVEIFSTSTSNTDSSFVIREECRREILKLFPYFQDDYGIVPWMR